ncbi:hypothetical protein AB1K70_17755 [Bremerella sp. JC770]|uniref:hypothetical protein n=1 Tax=Bremerella sp. JC770 TaxID=3232137 RepID=UPI00345A6009
MNSYHRLSTWLVSVFVVGAFAGLGCQNSTGIPTGEVTGVITLNGQPAEGVSLRFVPESAMRPSLAITDSQGKYRARFVSTQTGVVLGPCVAQLSIYRGDSPTNFLPKRFNTEAHTNPEFHLDVTEAGAIFNFDIVYDGEIPDP